MRLLRRKNKEIQLMETKPLVSSKTFWVNLLGGAVTVITMLGSISFLPASWAPWFAGALAVVNVALRIITDQPISGVVKSQ